MLVAEIYNTLMGEVNPFGIGAPAIFLRLSGCPLRCYKKTLGTLCDTPLYLEKRKGDEMPIDFIEAIRKKEFHGILSIADRMNAIRMETGISLICLTGGDPLWNDAEELHKLFRALSSFQICVETSGCLDPSAYLKYEHVSFILDYKSKSTGENTKNKHEAFNAKLRKQDFIKFVIYDADDYREMVGLLKTDLFRFTNAKIAAGVFWGGQIGTFELFHLLEKDRLLDRVSINMQAHKLIVTADPKKFVPEKI
jgi:organic radical activating enzyme